MINVPDAVEKASMELFRVYWIGFATGVMFTLVCSVVFVILGT